MKDKTLQIIEQHLREYKDKINELDKYYKCMEMSEKTVDVYNVYIRDRIKIKGSIEALVNFRVKYCEEMI